jgi:hypothetical protein
MSSTVYFRPSSASPYYMNRLAAWLVHLRYFNNIDSSLKYLINIERTRPDIFKNHLDAYHRSNDFRAGYLISRSDHNAFRSAQGSYGEEAHMYF